MHDHDGQRFGYAVAVIFLALEVWYWSRQMLYAKTPEGHASAGDFPRLTAWTPRVLGCLAFAIAIASLFRVADNYGVPEPVAELHQLAFILFAAMIVFVAFTMVRRRMMHREAYEPQDAHQKLVVRRWILIPTLLVAAALFLVSTFAVQRTVILGSAALVICAFALLVPVGCALVWLGTRAGVPVLTFLVLWALAISPLADNHVVETIAAAPQRPAIHDAFDRWFERLMREQKPGADGRYPVILVATEGGGIRAAYWTAAVLTSLTDSVPTFPEHLFAISGVSGGSLGATVYEGLLVRRADYAMRLDELEYEPQRGENHTLRFAARQVLSQDSLAPTLAAMLQPDLAQRFIPFALLPDRARALEGGWERAWRTAIARPNGQPDDLFSTGFVNMLHGREERLPSLFLNGTLVETGHRIIASNLTFDPAQLPQSIDLFGAIGDDVRVSTAVDNSTRFAYVSPAATLRRGRKGNGGSPVDCSPGERCEHVIDGGYFENSGAHTTSDILQIIAHSKYASRVNAHVIFIQFEMKQPPPIDPVSFANEVLAPLRGLGATRGARGEVDVASLQLRMPASYTAFQLIQDKAVFPLGWLLADRTRNLMDAQMGPLSRENGANVARIAALLGVPIGRDPVQELAAKSEVAPKFRD